MDFALAQLALIFLPGIIWANLDSKYGAGPHPSQSTLLIRAFLFGITTYSLLFILYYLCGKEFAYVELGNDAENVNLFVLKDEIAWSIPLSFTLSIAWLYSVKYRLIMKFLHLIGATARYGDEDVWSFTFNLKKPYVEYVHIRDVENGYIFAGWVSTYSENEDIREILLKDAIVYDDNGTEISSSPHLYLSRDKNNIWIEFPYKQNGD